MLTCHVWNNKIHCGGKTPFGLKLQGTLDSNGCFLDVFIGHPDSSSDHLTFMTSPFFYQLDKPPFLAPGLAWLGDNAYVSNRYMVTPFKQAKEGLKDAINYFQSQL